VTARGPSIGAFEQREADGFVPLRSQRQKRDDRRERFVRRVGVASTQAGASEAAARERCDPRRSQTFMFRIVSGDQGSSGATQKTRRAARVGVGAEPPRRRPRIAGSTLSSRPRRPSAASQLRHPLPSRRGRARCDSTPG